MVLINPLLTKTISFHFSMFVFLSMKNIYLKNISGESEYIIAFGLFETFNKV